MKDMGWENIVNILQRMIYKNGFPSTVRIHCGENDIGDIPCSPSAKSEKASNKVCVIPLVDRIVGFNSLYDVTYISPL